MKLGISYRYGLGLHVVFTFKLGGHIQAYFCPWKTNTNVNGFVYHSTKEIYDITL